MRGIYRHLKFSIFLNLFFININKNIFSYQKLENAIQDIIYIFIIIQKKKKIYLERSSSI